MLNSCSRLPLIHSLSREALDCQLLDDLNASYSPVPLGIFFNSLSLLQPFAQSVAQVDAAIEIKEFLNQPRFVLIPDEFDGFGRFDGQGLPMPPLEVQVSTLVLKLVK